MTIGAGGASTTAVTHAVAVKPAVAVAPALETSYVQQQQPPVSDLPGTCIHPAKAQLTGTLSTLTKRRKLLLLLHQLPHQLLSFLPACSSCVTGPAADVIRSSSNLTSLLPTHPLMPSKGMSGCHTLSHTLAATTAAAVASAAGVLPPCPFALPLQVQVQQLLLSGTDRPSCIPAAANPVETTAIHQA